MQAKIGARVKATTELGFGSVPKGMLGTVTDVYRGKDRKLHIAVEWDNRVTNVWVESSFQKWFSEAPATEK